MTQNLSTQDWGLLAVGDQVQVKETHGRPYQAIIDDKTTDSAVVWVVDPNGYRRAFDHREDIELIVEATDTPAV